MYIQTEFQKKSEKNLKKEKFVFSNWIPSHPDANGLPVEGTETEGCMIMVRRTNSGREYKQIDPNGNIN